MQGGSDGTGKRGVTINGRIYNFSYVEPGDAVEPADLVLISVKQTNLDESIRAIKIILSVMTRSCFHFLMGFPARR
jgi:ketopantoate reductase